jgi:hypothetical protein
MSREPIQDRHNVDLTKPVDKSKLSNQTSVQCFGKEWDMTSKECPLCAMNDICGVLYQDVIGKATEEMEKKHGGFLDVANFDLINKDELTEWIRANSGEIKTKDLLAEVERISHVTDEVALVLWVKGFLKSTQGIYTKEGVVWAR